MPHHGGMGMPAMGAGEPDAFDDDGYSSYSGESSDSFVSEGDDFGPAPHHGAPMGGMHMPPMTHMGMQGQAPMPQPPPQRGDGGSDDTPAFFKL